ncbi:MAG TPA: hypothetical protein VK363_19325, partial [Pyrinomonadaceae bacterium]|nr:hypothetical protein [Pyrinomonadaceae bacterium]
MKKSERRSISENLDKALAPPTPKRRPALATGLADYDDDPPHAAHPPSGGQTPLRGQTPAPPPIAPARDYNKRANSIERDALPSGMFPGGSKKLYDALYLRTRGHVKPSRTLRATKKDLSVWSGIKNRKTIDAHLRYFDMVGLVRRAWRSGQNEGYEFEVFLPEEIGQGDRPPVVVGPLEASDQRSARGSDQRSGSGGQTQAAENAGTSGAPQTIFKTVSENADDEAAAVCRSFVNELARELSGREGKPGDYSSMRELFDVILTEAKIAGDRTGVVSSPVAFVAEHLRRRLFKK